MSGRFALSILAALVTLGCGGAASTTPPGNSPGSAIPIAFPGDALYVANQGSNSISAFHFVSPLGGSPVAGAPFQVAAPPTALGVVAQFAGGQVDLIVLSSMQKTISLFKVDRITSALTGPLCTINTPYTPQAVTTVGGLFAPGTFFYVANSEGNFSVYQLTPDGECATEIPGSPFPAGQAPTAIAAAEPVLGGAELYVANSQSNSISGFSLDLSTGLPSPLTGSPFPAGTHPSSVEAAMPNPLRPAMVFVTNVGSNNVSVYSMDSNGNLTSVLGSPFPAGAAPAAVAVRGPYLYVANSQSNNVSGYSIDGTTGALTPLAGSPFPTEQNPSAFALSSFGVFLYVVNTGSNDLTVFGVDPNTGALTPVIGSPFPVGNSPRALVYFQGLFSAL